MTSETNPESGHVTYTYDTDGTCGTSKGDLVRKMDAVGNVTSFTYDGLHRNVTVTYPSGAYSGVTPAKTFVYDAATVNGAAMANAKGRLAEAYTGAAASKTTDIGISYSARGETAAVYQASPHSSGYYHVAATYWANGAVNTLNSGLAGLPTWTYGVDGEGRPYSASASSGTNPVTSTLYNGFSLPTSVIYPVPWLGRAQNDTFSYDGNTGRMTQYQTGASSYSGALTWNANGTLASLATSVPAQTCNYVHDDLTRLASVACAASPSGWNQTFGYDAFGNISKTGSGLGVSFQPTYSTATNRYTAVPSGTPSYDANGNLNADGYHSYAWDADGNLTSLDGATTMVYDAFDRRVEETNSGTTTEILYGASGAKFAVLSGGTLIRLMTPLPGGGTGIYSGTAPSFYYMHPDWLGSVRAILGTGGGLLYDGAYAPYGEIYSPVGPPGYPGVFTGQNQDLAGDLYDFPAREYHPVQGRWVQPDSAGMAAVDFTNPQSWNRYGYVLGNPLALVDPTGLLTSAGGGDGGGALGGSMGWETCLYQQMGGGGPDLGDPWSGYGQISSTISALINCGKMFNSFSLYNGAPAGGGGGGGGSGGGGTQTGAVTPPKNVKPLKDCTGLPDIDKFKNAAITAIAAYPVDQYQIPWLRGIFIHYTFTQIVRAFNNTSVNVPYKNGAVAGWFTLGSVRPDAVYGNVTSPSYIFELKTGGARLTNPQLSNYHMNLPTNTRICEAAESVK